MAMSARERARKFRRLRPGYAGEYSRKWIKRPGNREKVNRRARTYRSRNPELVKARKRQWYLQNLERVQATNRAYYLANRERVIERVSKHRAKTRANQPPPQLDELGLCRLAAMAYGLRLINEHEDRLGLPIPSVSSRTLFQGNEGGVNALIRFVQVKADQIYKANLSGGVEGSSRSETGRTSARHPVGPGNSTPRSMARREVQDVGTFPGSGSSAPPAQKLLEEVAA